MGLYGRTERLKEQRLEATAFDAWHHVTPRLFLDSFEGGTGQPKMFRETRKVRRQEMYALGRGNGGITNDTRSQQARMTTPDKASATRHVFLLGWLGLDDAPTLETLQDAEGGGRGFFDFV